MPSLTASALLATQAPTVVHAQRVLLASLSQRLEAHCAGFSLLAPLDTLVLSLDPANLVWRASSKMSMVLSLACNVLSSLRRLRAALSKLIVFATKAILVLLVARVLRAHLGLSSLHWVVLLAQSAPSTRRLQKQVMLPLIARAMLATSRTHLVGIVKFVKQKAIAPEALQFHPVAWSSLPLKW